MYYRGAQAAIVVFDITSTESFDKAKVWVNELQRQGSPNIIIALAGNKSDLAQKRTVPTAVCCQPTHRRQQKGCRLSTVVAWN